MEVQWLSVRAKDACALIAGFAAALLEQFFGCMLHLRRDGADCDADSKLGYERLLDLSMQRIKFHSSPQVVE